MSGSQETEKSWIQVRPTYPYAANEGPDSVEYQWFPLSGEVRTSKVALGESVEVEVPSRIRHRYYWGDRSSAWSDEGSLLRPL